MTWKDIPGWEGFYQVSTSGEIRSLYRELRIRDPYGRMGIRRYRGRILKRGIAPNGYPLLRLTRPGKQVCFYVHDLVLLTFRGKKPRGKEACHNNGERTDCRLVNLRYGTRRENALDRHKHGTFKPLRGCENPHSPFEPKDIKQIREQMGDAFSQRMIARFYGVSHSTIGAILRRERYK